MKNTVWNDPKPEPGQEPNQGMETIMEITEKNTTEPPSSTRRNAILLGGAALASTLFIPHMASAQTVTDADILNFALNLEYLEAQFYTYATTGAGLPASSTAGGNGTVGGTVTIKANAKVPFTTSFLQNFALEVASDEQNHVNFLRTALATSAVAQPNIDLMNSFNALAMAAGLGATFDPFASETNFLLGAFIFEDVGVTAYQGAAGLLSNKTYLDKAAGIQGVEAYHAGSIRTRIFQAGSTAQSISQAIANTRAKLDGTGNDDIGVMTSSTGAATIVDNNAQGMTYARTTGQVLSIVYGGGAAGVGGAFYPSAMNGAIK